MLFANDFFIAWHYVPMLTCCAFITALNSFLESIFNARKETSVIARTTIVGAITTVLLSVPLIGMLGAYGCGLATLIGYGVVLAIREKYYRSTSSVPLGDARSSLVILLLSFASLLLPFEGVASYLAFLLEVCALMLLRREVVAACTTMLGVLKKQLSKQIR